MKLFLKDNWTFFGMYLLNFLCLPLIFKKFSGFEEHFAYYLFLNIFIMIFFILIKYLNNHKVYSNLSKTPDDLADILIDNPRSELEKAYLKSQTQYYKLFNEKILELENIQNDYKMLIDQNVHQMKTPLAIISMKAQENIDDENFEVILNQVNKLNYNLQQTIKFLSLNSLNNDLYIEKIHLNSFLKNLINKLKDYFIMNRVYPSLNIDDDIYVLSDRHILENILYQIITNAIKYSYANSKVEITCNRINPSDIKLDIKNYGMGISQSDINRIFTPFFTGDNTKQLGESTGIGLYIAKKSADLLNHSISVQSSPNENTTFSLSLKTGL